jgi:hypothetical protein
MTVDHRTTVQELGEGCVRAECSCGWRSPVFGADKTTGAMGPTAAGDGCWRSARVGRSHGIGHVGKGQHRPEVPSRQARPATIRGLGSRLPPMRSASEHDLTHNHVW